MALAPRSSLAAVTGARPNSLSGWGEGPIHATDITGLNKEHAIIFAPGDTDQAGQIVLHGCVASTMPWPFDKREDWRSREGGATPLRGCVAKAITVIGWPPGVQSERDPTVAPKPKATRAESDDSGADPVELLLEDAPESMIGKDQDLWTNETW